MDSILVIKTGALGDVVRTGCLLNLLNEKYKGIKIYWYAENSYYLISKLFKNLNIHFINSKTFNKKIDLVLSLEERIDLLSICNRYYTDNNTLFYGFYESNGLIFYSINTSAWNDMGLYSRFGINIGNQLKKLNTFTFLEIWSSILNLKYENLRIKNKFKKFSVDDYILICPWGGDRWPSKSLSKIEISRLIKRFTSLNKKIIICGIPPSNFKFSSNIKNLYVDTSNNIDRFIKLIKNSSYIISADSLAIHIAFLFKIKSCSFYSPTSAAEIDVIKGSVKLLSIADDYCSYKPNADNSSITAKRILNLMNI